jgi:hypothetical protein
MKQGLRYPVHFVHGSPDRWTDIAADHGRAIALEELAPRLKLGREIWIVQAFHVLRDRGHEVTFSGSLREGSINVLHVDDFPWDGRSWKAFAVGVRADRDPVFATQIDIVQNRSCQWRPRDVFIPHWPQPGLLARQPERGSTLETLVYMGKEANLAPEFRADRFQRELADLGLRLIIRDEGWWDYRDADVVLAVRGGSPAYLRIKPASKLVNAWLAGCPAILSAEPGYREMRTSPLDYIEAATPGQVIEALARLRSDPNLYRRMVKHGRVRAADHTTDAVARSWERALAGPISRSYEEWMAAPGWAKALRAPRQTLARLRARVWGYQSVQPVPSTGRRHVNALRRALTLPAALDMDRPLSHG